MKDGQQIFGRVTRIQDGIFLGIGLPSLTVGEVVSVKLPQRDERLGLVFDVEGRIARLVLITGLTSDLRIGQQMYRTFIQPMTRSGNGVLGHIVSTFGRIVDLEDLSPLDYFILKEGHTEMISITNLSPTIIERMPVRIPLYTGFPSVDGFFPIGRGQRQLLIGDNKTGKTTFSVTTILNQASINAVTCTIDEYGIPHAKPHLDTSHLQFTPCIYVAVGQRRAEIVRLYRLLAKRKALYYTCIIFSSPDLGACEQYLAPYAGCAIGEWFRFYGNHALIVYDDLTQQAIAYRQLSLLLRRPPAREAYPADIFFLHARLLERAAQIHTIHGNGSLTALPIIETQMGDIASYIPTNVISITDGQIFLSRKLANAGRRPAVDFGLSVSRIGSAAQIPVFAGVSKQAKLTYGSYRRLQTAEKVGGELPYSVQMDLARGLRMNLFMTQAQHHTYELNRQIFGLFLLSGTYFDDLPIKHTRLFLSFAFNPLLVRAYAHPAARNFLGTPIDLLSFWLGARFIDVEREIKRLCIKIRNVSLYLHRVLQLNPKLEEAVVRPEVNII